MDGMQRTDQSEKIYTATIRFSPKRPDQKRVIDYIKKREEGVSISEYITAAILHYEETILAGRKEDVLAAIQMMIETTLTNLNDRKKADGPSMYSPERGHRTGSPSQEGEPLWGENGAGHTQKMQETESPEDNNQLPEAALDFLRDYL